MTKNYLVGGITALAFFFVVGYDYYTGNISVSAKKVVERATSEISDLSGLQEALQGGDETDGGDVTDGSADGGELSGDDSGDISGDDGGDMADGTADDSDVSDVSGDMSDFGNADIADFGNADIADFGNADIADFGNADIADFGNADIADFGNGDISDLAGLGGFDIADLLADSDLLGGLSDIAGLLGGGNNGGDVSGDLSGDGGGVSSGIEDDFAAGKVSIYSFPNPAHDIANFRFQLNETARVKITLYASNGQMVGEVLSQHFTPGEYVHRHDVSTLTPGIYVFSYQLNNSLPVMRRMIVK